MPSDRERARQLVLAHGWNATAYQILNPGIELWFAPDGSGVVGYVTRGRTRVVAGAPVCAIAQLDAVTAAFESEAATRKQRVCYFAAESRLEARARNHAKLLLGAQPVWQPEHLVAVIARRPSLRAQLHRARNKGVTVAEWGAERVEGNADLGRCLAEWLTTRGLPALHFLVETETLAAVRDRRVFVAERDHRPMAFLVATPIPTRDGWLIEQIVRGRAACNGTSELLLDAAARALAASGARMMTLGLAPLSAHGTPAGHSEPFWLRTLLGWLRAHGRRFYDFRGLEAFKAKFEPEGWEPIYALTTASRIDWRTLHAIAGAFARGSLLLLMVRGVGRAIRSELRRVLAFLKRPRLRSRK